jgi:hypothetical protein
LEEPAASIIGAEESLYLEYGGLFLPTNYKHWITRHSWTQVVTWPLEASLYVPSLKNRTTDPDVTVLRRKVCTLLGRVKVGQGTGDGEW